MLEKLANNPTRIVSAAVGIVTAIVALLVAFGVHITDDQKIAIIGLVTAIGAVAVGGNEMARKHVMPMRKVRKLLPESIERRMAHYPMPPAPVDDDTPPPSQAA